MREKLVIIGNSTSAKHVYDFVTGYNLFQVVGFAVDAEYRNMDTFCGLPVYDLGKLDAYFEKKDIKVFVAVLWNRLNADRRSLYERMRENGYQMANLISPHAVIRGTVKGDNCWLHDYVIVQSEAEIGADCLLMAFTLIGDYSKIGAHCFTGAKSTIGGKSVVGEQTFIGMNCTVFDDTIIGKKCILGACTAVKRNVPDYSVVKNVSDNSTTIQLDDQTIEQKLLFKKNVR
ncbi:MAG TPA: acetyltransferase [Lachnospiraceae bacterium]|nr:acetyltransferase [Lachnospiraceae bacterium]